MGKEAEHTTAVTLGGSSVTVGSTVGHGADYYERKAAGLCTRGNCSRPLAPESQLCARHLARKRRSDRESVRRRRAAERDAGRCACGCGAKSETWLAPGCAIRLNQIPRRTVGSTVGHERAGQWRADNDGWERFRGRGRRGAPPAGANDEFELRMILDAIRQGTEGLAYARSPEVAELGRITRQAAKDEVAALFAHAARGLDDLVDRLRKGG